MLTTRYIKYYTIWFYYCTILFYFYEFLVSMFSSTKFQFRAINLLKDGYYVTLYIIHSKLQLECNRLILQTSGNKYNKLVPQAILQGKHKIRCIEAQKIK